MGQRSGKGAGQQKSVEMAIAWGHSPSEGIGREDDALGGMTMGMGCYVLETPNFIFHLLTNTFSSRDLFPPPFHHMTLPPDRLPIILTM